MAEKNFAESDLYLPVKSYLESLGYQVKGEVRSCDLTATKDRQLIVVELKKGFTMELIYQALRRQMIADSVYLAVPLPKRGYQSPRYGDMLRLCRRLSLGLILLGFSLSGAPQIDLALHPAPPAPIRRNKKERLAVLTEHQNRTGGRDMGGVTRRKILTVYKEQALTLVRQLKEQGPLTAADLRKQTGIDKTSSILGRNVYHWFEKAEDHGNRNTLYCITQKGIDALSEYQDLFPPV